MNSMTGFGKAELKTKSARYIVEISSVNNRYLEISPRLPRQFFSLEPKVREFLKAKISRGKINLYVGFEEISANSRKYTINSVAIKSYYNQLSKIQKELKIGGNISIDDLIALPEISRPENGEINDKQVWAELKKVLDTALKDFVKMRQKEGLALKQDMNKRIKILNDIIFKIKKQSPRSVKSYRDRLNKRLGELLNSSLPDNIRIEEEITLLAERSDISEECTRFISHLKQYQTTITKKEAIGKKLNFILQELNREANTIASKCSDIYIAKNVITIKEEIEKLREQVQNIE